MKAKILLVVCLAVIGGVIFFGVHEPSLIRAPAEIHVKAEPVSH